MNEWYRSSWKDIVSTLNSDIYNGLSEGRVNEYRDLYGDNKIKYPKDKHWILLLISMIFKWWSISIAIAATIFYVNKYYLYSAVIISIFVFSIIFMVYQEYRQQKKMKSFQKLNIMKSKVIRNGKFVELNADEVVRGDIVVLEKGISIPADLRIVESESLKIKETSITGVSGIVEKYCEKIQGRDIPLSEMKNMAFKTSVVQDGSGKGIVVTTGMNTNIGRIVKKISEENVKKTSFENSISGILNLVAKLFIIFTVLTGFFKYFIQHKNNMDMLNLSSKVMISFPYSIVIITYLIWIIIKGKLRKEGVIFKNLSVMEKLSKINIILDKKVGVFTKKYCFVKNIYTEGEFKSYLENQEIEGNVKRLIEISVLSNNSKAKYNENGIEIIGDIKDSALYRFGKEHGIDKREVKNANRQVLEIPTDNEKRIATTVNKVDDFYRANVKGAVDSILKRCTHIMKNGIEKEIKEEDVVSIREAHMKMASSALDVIAVAYRNFNYEPSLKENIESNLIFVGLIGFENSIKEETNLAMEKAKQMTIKPLIITDNYKLSSIAFGKKMSILYNSESVLSGIEMKYMSEDEIERTVEKISVFSRISSEQKATIVGKLKKCGYNILTVGSKLIEIPALSEATVAVALGDKCSNIVKKLSDVFLGKSDFSKLINLIELNKKLLNAIKNVYMYIFVFSLSEAMLLIYGCIYENKLVLTVNQIMWLNLVTVTLSSLAIFLKYDYMKFSNYKTNIINKENFKRENLFGFILISFLFATATYLTFKFSLGNFYERANSTFVVFGVSQSLFALAFINDKDKRKKFNIGNILLIINIVFILSYFISIQIFKYNYIWESLRHALTVGIFIIFQIILGKITKKTIVK